MMIAEPSYTALETLTQPLTEELRQLQRELSDFDMKLQQIVCGLNAAETGGERDAIRMALALDQLRADLSALFSSPGRTQLSQMANQAGAKLSSLSTHFRAVARREQIHAQVRRT